MHTGDCSDKETIGAASHVCAYLHELHKFARPFICDDLFKLACPQTDVKHSFCLAQRNLIDCGLHSLDVVLYVIHNVPINNNIFDL